MIIFLSSYMRKMHVLHLGAKWESKVGKMMMYLFFPELDAHRIHGTAICTYYFTININHENVYEYIQSSHGSIWGSPKKTKGNLSI